VSARLWRPEEVADAAAVLRGGGLVAFPTETVYGLGARADDPDAVARIFAAKGRPRFNPLIAHVPGLAEAEAAVALPPEARRLAEAFWPGPLTLVAPRRAGGPICDLAAAGLATAAVRAPDHPLAQALLAAVGAPVAAPSANPSGAVSPTTAAHVLDGLGAAIDGVLDGGPCFVGVESTIVAITDGAPRLLRPGGLPAEAIEAALGRPLLAATAGDAPAAPGMLSSHYAPGATLRLDADSPATGEAWLGFGPDPEGVEGPARNLSPEGELRAAAAALYRDLRALDVELGGTGVIAVAPIPSTGLGAAITDRLRRAAAPRPAPPLKDP
jgi:L-threonylcarbamoyladenylate synthase